DNLKQAKGSSEILSRALVLGSIQSGVEPVLEKTGGEMSYDIASRLVGTSFTLEHYLPLAPVVNEALSAVITANQVQKPDIWGDRDVVLPIDADAESALIAVWDSGVDTSLFPPEQLWRNEGEVPANNRDDDKNGYVDDVHGIAWSLHWDSERRLLYPIGELADDTSELERQSKGLSDIVAAVDSEEASELRKKLSALEQDKVEGFLESLRIYGNYSHGTHVSGIALAGNPFARLLTVRMTFGHTIIPEKPTLELALKEADGLKASVDYMKAQGVRAVNMSWGGSLAGIEAALEAHDVGDTPEERKALARRYYNITNDALRGAIADAEDILFITSAGNSDNDVKFDEFYPSSYELPNILSVGAVDQAGQETSFTSLGKVDIYANGFEVDSYVPGGSRQKLSGTSMASPQVLNLAGKLLALAPGLSTAELRELILQGADSRQLEEREIRLLNQKASMTLLERRQSGS
ncbi:MAG: S8 family serine peptidase, partial [Halieaceae bacterium]|nr:S8 family serine peptidase [Halieaceae bacterium]